MALDFDNLRNISNTQTILANPGTAGGNIPPGAKAAGSSGTTPPTPTPGGAAPNQATRGTGNKLIDQGREAGAPGAGGGTYNEGERAAHAAGMPQADLTFSNVAKALGFGFGLMTPAGLPMLGLKMLLHQIVPSIFGSPIPSFTNSSLAGKRGNLGPAGSMKTSEGVITGQGFGSSYTAPGFGGSIARTSQGASLGGNTGSGGVGGGIGAGSRGGEATGHESGDSAHTGTGGGSFAEGGTVLRRKQSDATPGALPVNNDGVTPLPKINTDANSRFLDTLATLHAGGAMPGRGGSAAWGGIPMPGRDGPSDGKNRAFDEGGTVYAKGGAVAAQGVRDPRQIPDSGHDSESANLRPGEFVLTRAAAECYSPQILATLNDPAAAPMIDAMLKGALVASWMHESGLAELADIHPMLAHLAEANGKAEPGKASKVVRMTEARKRR